MVQDGLHSDAGRMPMRTQQRGGLSLMSQTSGRGRPIGPMEDVEGAENNLGLDDIPQGLGGGMDLCWLQMANEIRGRPLMRGGTGGPRALKAFGKTCKGNKRIGYKALMVYSLELDKGDDTTRDANLRACFIWLYLRRVIVT